MIFWARNLFQALRYDSLVEWLKTEMSGKCQDLEFSITLEKLLIIDS